MVKPFWIGERAKNGARPTRASARVRNVQRGRQPETAAQVPAHARKAYKAKRAEQALRCRRAVQRNFDLCVADVDAVLAWQTHVQESRNFVATLNPYYPSAKEKLKCRSVSSAGKAPSFCTSNVHAPSERNFMKSYNTERNGVAANIRKRIPCENSFHPSGRGSP